VNRLREALQRADIEELEAIGQQAVAVAIAGEVEPPAAPREDPEQRQRILDAALGDVVEIVNRHRQRLGRRICSVSDAKVIRQVHELLRSMAGADGGADQDPSFQ
jgi:hypothetical protein